MDSNSSHSSDELIIKLDATSVELDELMQTKNEAVRKAVVLHPNTSPETLIKLFGDYYDSSCSIDYLEQVFKNPSLELILLEQPDFFDRLLNQPYSSIYSRRRFPRFFIDCAVNHAEASVRSDIAANYYIPISCLNELPSPALAGRGLSF